MDSHGDRSSETDTVVLLKRWNRGDDEALNLLVQRHLPRVRKYVHQRLGNRLRQKDDTGDVVQDAMLQFLRYSPRFQVEDGRHFQALIRRIVENVLRDKHDWYARKRREMDRECALPASSVFYLGSSHAPPRPGEVAQQNEQHALVRLSLELLRGRDREIIILREYDGLSHTEIAQRLDMNEPAVRMRLSRALNRLGQRMSDILDEKLE